MNEQGSSNSGGLVVAVVLTWNDVELTSNCLASVLASNYANLKVLLVDNGSKPQRGGELKEKFPQIEVLQLEENQGFSGGANRGMERALDLGAQYVHVIGNDSTLAKDTISLIVHEFEASVDTGAASPILLNPGEPKIVQFYEATVDRDIAQHIHLRVGEPYRPERFPTTESEFIPMVAVMFRSKALLEIGLLDEEFGTCWEDYDLCMRLQNAGWKYKTIGAAQAKHIGSHTTGKESPYILYYTTRNRLICLRRHANAGYWRRRFWDLVRSFGHQFKVNGVLNFSANYAMLRGMFDYAFKIRGETQGNLTRLDS
jgi:hypothetical protein